MTINSNIEIFALVIVLLIHTCVLISKHGMFSSGVSLGIKTHPPDQNRHHLLAGHFMNC